jgi:hypothetical protein
MREREPSALVFAKENDAGKNCTNTNLLGNMASKFIPPKTTLCVAPLLGIALVG